MFKHTNEIIIIGTATLTFSEFKQLEPDYSLPDGMITRYYDPSGNKHILKDGVSQFDGGDWPEGEIYLSKEATYAEFAREKHVVDAQGNYLGTVTGEVPPTQTEVLDPPADSRQKRQAGAWVSLTAQNIFDDAWPLSKQVEAILEDKRGNPALLAQLMIEKP